MCSGSFKVLRRTVKDLGTQVVKQLCIHDTCDFARERRGCWEQAAGDVNGVEEDCISWASAQDASVRDFW